jgi:hypothetical protein
MSESVYQFSKPDFQVEQDLPRSQIYYCGFCYEILLISKRILNKHRILLAFNNSCPKCEAKLNTSLRCSLTSHQFNDDLRINRFCDPEYLLEPKTALRPHYERPILTQQLELCIGISGIDDLTTFKAGQFVVLSGSRKCGWLSELLCLRAQLPPPRGFGSCTIFLDGTNTYDPYLISKFAEEHGQQPSDALQGIRVSRAFTCYQMSSLIHSKLSAELQLTDARLIVASDLLALYCDPELVEKREGRELFRKAIKELSQIARTRQILVVATIFSVRDRALENDAFGLCDVYLNILEDERVIKAELRKHPLKAEKCRHIPSYDNTTLDGF